MINDLKKLVPKETIPGFLGRFIHSLNMTLAYWEIKKGSTSPEHAHPHEQVVYVLEGEFELTLEGNPIPLVPGKGAHYSSLRKTWWKSHY